MKIDPEWKKKLAATLKDVGLIGHNFTGKINCHIATGGVSRVVKEEALK